MIANKTLICIIPFANMILSNLSPNLFSVNIYINIESVESENTHQGTIFVGCLMCRITVEMVDKFLSKHLMG